MIIIMEKNNNKGYLWRGGSEYRVFRLEAGDTLHELGDSNLQHFDLLANGEHEVTLDQIHRLLDLVVDGHRTAPRTVRQIVK